MKDKYCLESVAPFLSILNSPTNRSATKQTFSFARSPRFPQPQSNCPLNTYDGQPITRKDSGTGMGYGRKFDFTRSLAVSPESSKYHFKTIFQANKDTRKGCSIGNSREKIIFDSYIDPYKLKHPGVARYSIDDKNASRTMRAPVYSMRSKTIVVDKTMTIQPQNKNPGPSDYQNNPQISKTLYGSRFARIGYSNAKSKRFLNSDNHLPGPCNYQNPTNLSNVGKYLLSSHRGGTNAKFDSAARTTHFDEAAKVGSVKPGPGDYKATSQFGQYDGNVYDRNPQKQSRKLLK